MREKHWRDFCRCAQFSESCDVCNLTTSSLRQLHARRPDETDPDMLAHVSELIQELETVKGVTMTDVEAHIAKLEQEAQTSRQNGQDGEDGWEDVGDDEQGVADSEMA